MHLLRSLITFTGVVLHANSECDKSTLLSVDNTFKSIFRFTVGLGIVSPL